jgi:hypothetical protein
MSEQKMQFGYVDDTDESLKSKSGGLFGLNTPAYLTKFELNPNAGADGAASDALDMTFTVGDREFRNRIYPTTKVYDSKGNELQPDHPDYVKLYNADWSQKNAVIVHVLKAFRTDEEVRSALSAPLTSFADFANVVAGLLPTEFNTVALDLFLEYQWKIGDGQDRTYLQVPKNMKGGYFVCKAQAPANGDWTAVKDDNGLRYVDGNGTEHPFTRDKNYMAGNKANQQIEGEEASNAALAGAASSASAGTW